MSVFPNVLWVASLCPVLHLGRGRSLASTLGSAGSALTALARWEMRRRCRDPGRRNQRTLPRLPKPVKALFANFSLSLFQEKHSSTFCHINSSSFPVIPDLIGFYSGMFIPCVPNHAEIFVLQAFITFSPYFLTRTDDIQLFCCLSPAFMDFICTIYEFELKHCDD